MSAEQFRALIGDTRDIAYLKLLQSLYVGRFCQERATLLQQAVLGLEQAIRNDSYSDEDWLALYQIIFNASLIYAEQPLRTLLKTLIGLARWIGAPLHLFLQRIQPITSDNLEELSAFLTRLEFCHSIIKFDLYLYDTVSAAMSGLENACIAYAMSTTREVPTDLRLRLSQDPDLRYPLNESTIQWITQQFQQTGEFEEQFLTLSLVQLRHRVPDLKQRLYFQNTGVSIHEKQRCISELMAIANRVLVHQFLIHPYPVQLLTVLALLSPNLPDRKGYLAQVKTGEGKSMILALTALTMACQGKCVDVITSTAHLAQRDQQKYANFFHWFDISSSCLAKSQLSQQEFAGQIVYGPNFQFEFSILFDDLCRKHYRALYSDPQQTRPFHVALVDEVDNMLVDKGTQSARIAYPTDDTLLPLYPKLYDYIATYASPDHPPGKALTDACRMLAEGFGVNEKKLNQLVESAYSACFHQQQNIHYRVQRSITSHNKFKQSNEIIIIDDNTGRLAQASRWQYGLHAFLEHKHQLPIQADTATIGSLSHPSFFACYPEIYGLTGTVGEDADRSEVSDIYNLGTFDMPTDKPRQLTRYDMQIAESEHHFNDLLVDELKQMQIKGRPCLLINSSVQQSQEMVARLKKAGLTANVQLLNDIQEETEEYVVDSAGKPGTITSATNAAGRGTDIPLSDESINNGGLHVIFTFFPANARVEEQGAGRAARQGQPGSYRILVPVTDPLLKAAQQYWFQKKKVMTTEHLINFLMESIRLESGVTPDIADLAAVRSTELCAFRTDRVTTLSQNRRQAARLGQIQYQLLTQFTAWYQTRLHDTRQSRHQLLSEWARCYDEIEMIQPEHTAQGLQFEENLTIYAAQAGALVSQFLQSCQQPDV